MSNLSPFRYQYGEAIRLAMLRSISIIVVLCTLTLSSGQLMAREEEQGQSELDKIVLQLKWKHAFQFAGYYMAKEKGYYREMGVEVEILESGPGIDPVQEVVLGRANFGVGDSSVVIERAEGYPVVVLGVVFQHSAIVLLALRHTQTQSVHDLSGKNLMLVPNSHELRAYLQKSGLGPAHYQVQAMSFDINDLVKGNTDAFSAYITEQPYALEQRGIAYVAFSPRSAGIDFYGDNLFTSESELRNHRQRAESFRDASMRGWSYAMANIEETVELILSTYSSERDQESLRFEANQMIPLLQPELVEMGYMLDGRWRHIAETYAEIGILSPDFSLDGLVYKEKLSSPRDLSWLYRLIAAVLVALLLITYVALRFYRLSRTLASDIAARKQAELEKVELEAQLLHSQKIQAIGTLAGGMAHDMNNVLAVILGLGSVLEEDLEPGTTQYEDIRDIMSAAERGQSMVANLLGFARKGKFQLSTWNPNDGVQQIVSMLGKTLAKTIVIKTSLKAKQYLHCDSNQIVSALMNLCVNAAHAIGDKGEITIESHDKTIAADETNHPTLQPGCYLSLIVRDNGKGMSEQTRKRVFDPFFTTKDIGEGTGLGLSMVYGVVESHNGSVSIESELGAGTTVTLLLPAVAAPSADDVDRLASQVSSQTGLNE
ncbi:MAG: ABC transporter substrate-binding protein [Kofleriaceae bacterium]|nr:ABC transporter substrate-binding protein [Kofleriaceae bacterium]